MGLSLLCCAFALTIAAFGHVPGLQTNSTCTTMRSCASGSPSCATESTRVGWDSAWSVWVTSGRVHAVQRLTQLSPPKRGAPLDPLLGVAQVPVPPSQAFLHAALMLQRIASDATWQLQSRVCKVVPNAWLMLHCARGNVHAPAGAALFNIYVHYCSSGRGMVGQGRSEEMLSHQFAKLCKDAKLINNKNLTKADVDIIYHGCVVGARSVSALTRHDRSQPALIAVAQALSHPAIFRPCSSRCRTPSLHASGLPRSSTHFVPCLACPAPFQPPTRHLPYQYPALKCRTAASCRTLPYSARAADEALETYVKKAGVAATARMYYPQFLFALDKVCSSPDSRG